MTTIKFFINRRLVLTYFTLTFIISWGSVLILVGPSGIPVTTEQLEIVGLAMLLGPSIVGILLIGLTSGKLGFRKLLSRLFRWRVGAQWYAVALLIAPLSTIAALLMLLPFSPEFLPTIFTSDNKATLLLIGVTAGLMVGFFEELGWTGFSVPQMRLSHGFLITGLTVGFIWGAWHFILFWESNSFSGVLPIALLLGRLFSWLPAYRLLMVWVHDRTRSLLVTMIMHVSLVASTVIIEPPLTGKTLLTYILARAAILWIIVAIITLTKWQAHRKSS